jgi:hypothetical protein
MVCGVPLSTLIELRSATTAFSASRLLRIHVSEERLFQGPIADALTHVGQLAMLRRVAGSPAWSENYSVAKITAGCVGADQPAAVKRFR